jgi:hypothetical protein
MIFVQIEKVMLAYFKTRSLNVFGYTVKITKNLLRDSKKVRFNYNCTILLIYFRALYRR